MQMDPYYKKIQLKGEENQPRSAHMEVFNDPTGGFATLMMTKIGPRGGQDTHMVDIPYSIWLDVMSQVMLGWSEYNDMQWQLAMLEKQEKEDSHGDQ